MTGHGGGEQEGSDSQSVATLKDSLVDAILPRLDVGTGQ